MILTEKTDRKIDTIVRLPSVVDESMKRKIRAEAQVETKIYMAETIVAKHERGETTLYFSAKTHKDREALRLFLLHCNLFSGATFFEV